MRMIAIAGLLAVTVCGCGADAVTEGRAPDPGVGASLDRSTWLLQPDRPDGPLELTLFFRLGNDDDRIASAVVDLPCARLEGGEARRAGDDWAVTLRARYGTPDPDFCRRTTEPGDRSRTRTDVAQVELVGDDDVHQVQLSDPIALRRPVEPG